MTTPNTYDIGDQIQVQVNFTDLNNNPIDPTTVTFKYAIPGGIPTTGTATKQSTGVYTGLITTTIAGTYTYRFEGTGAVIAAAESTFLVRTSKFY